MKKIRVQVEYKVPHWAYCNNDSQEVDNLGKNVCRFCVKTRSGTRCALYNEPLMVDEEFISKARRCMEATAGIKSTVTADSVEPAPPVVNPKKIIKQSIELYVKTFNDLLNQGYPRQMAESIAKEYMTK